MPGLDNRRATKSSKSCITNGRLGTPTLFPSGVDPSLSRPHPPCIRHALLVHVNRYIGTPSSSCGGYKELQVGQHAYVTVFGTPSNFRAVLMSLGKDRRRISSAGV